MAAKTSTAKKTKTAQRYKCVTCGEEFTGKTCPNCGEKVNLLSLNKDGVPFQDIAEVAGLPPPDFNFRFERSPEMFDPEADLHEAVQAEYRSIRDEMVLDSIRTKAAEQAAKRRRAEAELERTEKGFEKPEQVEQAQQAMDVSPAIFLQALGGWDPEQREQFLDYLSSNPQAALAISMLMNPSKVNGQLPMMNPMMGMGLFPPPAPQPQVEQADAATMVTAMIEGMKSLKELSGGDGDSKATERILDKLERLEERNKELEIKISEAQNSKKESITTEDIRRIVADVMKNTTDGKVGLINGLKEIHTVRDELVNLGIAQKPGTGVDPSITLEEKKFEHQKEMDKKRAEHEHEEKIKREEAEIARSNMQSEFIASLLRSAQITKENSDGGDDDDTSSEEKTETTNTVIS